MDELRDRYHVGHHPPGYLADSAPACFDEWWLAANYLLVLMQEYADADDEAAYAVIGSSPAPHELLLDDATCGCGRILMRSCTTTRPRRAWTTAPPSRTTAAG